MANSDFIDDDTLDRMLETWPPDDPDEPVDTSDHIDEAQMDRLIATPPIDDTQVDSLIGQFTDPVALYEQHKVWEAKGDAKWQRAEQQRAAAIETRIEARGGTLYGDDPVIPASVMELPSFRDVPAENYLPSQYEEQRGRAPREQWEELGAIGFEENLRRQSISRNMERIPLIGGAFTTFRLGGVRQAALALEAHENETAYLDPDRRSLYTATVADFIFELDELTTRDKSFAAKVTDFGLDWLPFAAEFTVSGGGGAAARAGTKKAATRVAKGLLKRAAKRAIAPVIGGVKRTPYMMARVMARAAQERVPTFGFTPEGQIRVSDRGASAGRALVVGLGNTMIEMISEESGELLGAVGGRIPGVKRLLGKFDDVVGRAWGKAGGTSTGFSALLKQAGYHGVLQEMGEERLGDLMRALTGVEDFGLTGDKNTLGARIQMVWPGLEQLAIEAVGFSIPGIGGAVSGIRGRRQMRSAVRQHLLSPTGAMAYAQQFPGRAAAYTAVQGTPTGADLKAAIGTDGVWKVQDRITLANMLRKIEAYRATQAASEVEGLPPAQAQAARIAQTDPTRPPVSPAQLTARQMPRGEQPSGAEQEVPARAARVTQPPAILGPPMTSDQKTTVAAVVKIAGLSRKDVQALANAVSARRTRAGDEPPITDPAELRGREADNFIELVEERLSLDDVDEIERMRGERTVPMSDADMAAYDAWFATQFDIPEGVILSDAQKVGLAMAAQDLPPRSMDFPQDLPPADATDLPPADMGLPPAEAQRIPPEGDRRLIPGQMTGEPPPLPERAGGPPPLPARAAEGAGEPPPLPTAWERAERAMRRLEAAGAPITEAQAEQVDQIVEQEDVPPNTSAKIVHNITGGRTRKTGDLTQKEARQYADILSRREAAKKTVTTYPTGPVIADELTATVTAADITDPILRQLYADLEAEQARKIVKPSNLFRGIRKWVSQLWDADRAFHDLQERTGIPFFRKHQELQRAYRTARYSAHARTVDLFREAGIEKPGDFMGTPGAEQRVFDYIVKGEQEGLTEQEQAFANALYQQFTWTENAIKEQLFERWIDTRDMPTGATEATMQAGVAAMEADIAAMDAGNAPQAYQQWIASARFGLVDLYSEARTRGTPNLRLMAMSRFGRDLVGAEETAVVQYDPAFPLVGDIYRYFLKGANIRSVDPVAKEFRAMFKESGVKMPLIDRYFDNLTGSIEELDFVQTVLEKGMRQFYRVTIPQRIAKWSIRNLFQPFAITLPRVATPSDPLFWKHNWKLMAGGYSAFLRKRFEQNPGDYRYFKEFVSSMDAARQHYFFQEFSEFDMPALGPIMHVSDQITKVYGMSDEINRINTFFYGLDVGRDAIARYQAKPTLANWRKFLNVTGAHLSPIEEQKQMLAMVDLGDTDGAAKMAAERLSHATQFRYPRAERGLAWQARAGARQLAPIATFWKGSLQLVYKDSVRPVMDYLADKAKGRATSTQRARAGKAAKVFLSWYGMSLLVNRLFERMYDIDEGFYGVKTLRYVPGGPILANMIRTADAFWGVTKMEAGWDYKAAAALDALGDMAVPFYHALSETTGLVKGQANFGPLRDARRAVKDWHSRKTTGMSAPDRRKWENLTAVQMVQRLILGGAWSPSKDEVARQYFEWAAEPDPEKADALKKKLRRELRKYPVSTKRKDVPRDPEIIGALIPGLKRPEDMLPPPPPQ